MSEQKKTLIIDDDKEAVIVSNENITTSMSMLSSSKIELEVESALNALVLLLNIV